MKLCLICKLELDEANFNVDPTRKDGRHPWCKECVREYKKEYYLKNRERLLKISNTRRLNNLEEARAYDKKRQKENPKRKLRGRDTWIGRAKSLIAGMRNSSKLRGWEWKDEWWDATVLSEQIKEGKCCKTGIPFELINNIGDHYKTNPCTPSIDRKDNLKGYNPGNTQIVCWFYNNLKRDHTQEIIDELVEIMLVNKLIKEMEG